jgi:hypothetical protein
VPPLAHIDPDGLGEARRLIEPRLDITAGALPNLGQRNDRGSAPRDIGFIAVENAQEGSSACSLRFTGCSG